MMRKENHTISIIIPVYNEENYIVKTLEKVMVADTLGLKKELIVVDDYSTDRTVARVEKFMKHCKEKIMFFAKKQNEGKGAAVKKGILASTGDIVLIQDADLEYNPVDYPTLLTPFLSHDADVVYGSRFISDKSHRILYFWHYFGNKLLTMLSNIFNNLNLTDMETGYKAFRGEIIRKIGPRLRSQRFGFEPEVTARLAKINNIHIYEVGVSYYGRTYAEGKKINWKDGVRALGEIIWYSVFTR